MKRSVYLGIALTVAAVGLSGCSDTRKALGLDKAPPDEFSVMERAPLTMPPDYALRPPESSADKPLAASAAQHGQDAIFGGTSADDDQQPVQTPGLTAGESALLAKAGTAGATPGIRQEVNNEAEAEAKDHQDFIQRLAFWRQPPPPGQVVDANAEAQRLRQNAAAGKSPTDGETPLIVQKQRAPLEGIF